MVSATELGLAENTHRNIRKEREQSHLLQFLN